MQAGYQSNDHTGQPDVGRVPRFNSTPRKVNQEWVIESCQQYTGLICFEWHGLPCIGLQSLTAIANSQADSLVEFPGHWLPVAKSGLEVRWMKIVTSLEYGDNVVDYVPYLPVLELLIDDLVYGTEITQLNQLILAALGLQRQSHHL